MLICLLSCGWFPSDLWYNVKPAVWGKQTGVGKGSSRHSPALGMGGGGGAGVSRVNMWPLGVVLV